MDSLKGTITCSSMSRGEECRLEQMLNIFRDADNEVVDSGHKAIPCIVQEGTKFLRPSSNIKYYEKVYIFNFSWNPDPSRPLPMEKQTFYQTLLSYADYIGKEMELGRLYLDFDGKTELLETDI